jgi:hypothetical protein
MAACALAAGCDAPGDPKREAAVCADAPTRKVPGFEGMAVALNAYYPAGGALGRLRLEPVHEIGTKLRLGQHRQAVPPGARVEAGVQRDSPRPGGEPRLTVP